MKCQQVKQAMPLYYYGELPPEQEENVEAHCAECDPCGRELKSYRQFAGALDDAELEPSLGLLSECRELLARRVTEWEQPVASLALVACASQLEDRFAGCRGSAGLVGDRLVFGEVDPQLQCSAVLHGVAGPFD